MEVNTLPAVVQPKAVYSPHPLSASADRRIFYAAFETGESIDDYLVRNAIYPKRLNDFVLSLNDKRIPFEQWHEVFPNNGDLITLRAVVHGGGGEGGSDPIRTIATIAVLVASQGAAAGLLGIAASGAALAGTTALISVGGMLLVNALIPIKSPQIDEKQPSPTYSLSGSSNRARLFEPLPLVLGVRRMFPDHGAKPYTFVEGDDQKLIQVFNFGLSDVLFSNFKIGDTDLANFDDYDIEYSLGTTGDLLAYPSNVDSISGGDLVANVGNFIIKTTSVDTTQIQIDLSGFLFRFDRRLGVTDARLNLTIEFRGVGQVFWLPFRQISTIAINHGSKEALRLSWKRSVPKGQYEVRLKLEDKAFNVFYDAIDCYFDDSPEEEQYICEQAPYEDEVSFEDNNLTKSLSWDLLKSYQPDDADYSGQKRVALTIKASGQLNGRIDALNAIVAALIPVWNGSFFVVQPSSNPAWQFLWLARGKFDGTRRLFGAGLPDSRIDIETIKLWGAWCDAKGLECNVIFDSPLNVDAMLNIVARCGRGTSSWANGKLGVVYDEANLPVTAVFGMSNIVRNTFRVNYITGKLADEIIVAFSNPDIGYQRDTVSALVPGVTDPINSVTIPLRAITDKVQAGKEANLIAAEQFYRRRVISWECDMEGLGVKRGDVAALSHDLTQWDYSGRLESGSVDLLILNKKVSFTPFTQHYVGIRFPDGSYNIYDVELAIGEQSIIQLITPLPSAPDDDTDNSPIDYLWFFAPKPTPGKMVKITDIVPLSPHRVRISATDEDDNYYLSENLAPIYVPPGSFVEDLPTITNLSINEVLIKVGSSFASRVTVTWDINGEYGGAFIRSREEDKPFRDKGKTLDRRFSFESEFDRTITVEVVAFNLEGQAGDSSKAVKSLLLIGKRGLPSDVEGFSALQNGETMVFKWRLPLDVDLRGTILRYGPRGDSTWETAVPLTEVTKGTSVTSTDVPDGDWTFYAKHEDTSVVRNQSLNAATSNSVFTSNNDVINQRQESPFIRKKADLLRDGASFFVERNQNVIIDDATVPLHCDLIIKKDSINKEIRFPGIQLHYKDSAGSTKGNYYLNFETSSGDFDADSSGISNVTVIDQGNYWSLSFDVVHNNAQHINVKFLISPAYGASSTWINNVAVTGSISVWRARLLNDKGVNLLLSPQDFLLPPWEGRVLVTNNNDDAPEIVDGFVVHHTGKLVPASQNIDSTGGWETFDEFVPNPYPVCEYESEPFDIGFTGNVRILGTVQAQLGPGETGNPYPRLLVDCKPENGFYNGFDVWGIGSVVCRFIKHKIVLDTSVGLSSISGFLPTIDIKQITNREQHTIAAGGSVITFASEYYRPPLASANGVTVASGVLAETTITNVSETQALVNVYNRSGVSVGGDAVVTVTGIKLKEALPDFIRKPIPRAAKFFTGIADHNGCLTAGGGVKPTWRSDTPRFNRALDDTSPVSIDMLGLYMASDGGAPITNVALYESSLIAGRVLDPVTGFITGVHTTTTPLISTFRLIMQNGSQVSDPSPVYTEVIYDNAAAIPTINSIYAIDGQPDIYLNASEPIYTTAGSPSSYELDFILKVNGAIKPFNYSDSGATSLLHFLTDTNLFEGDILELTFSRFNSDLKSFSADASLANTTVVHNVSSISSPTGPGFTIQENYDNQALGAKPAGWSGTRSEITNQSLSGIPPYIGSKFLKHIIKKGASTGDAGVGKWGGNHVFNDKPGKGGDIWLRIHAYFESSFGLDQARSDLKFLRLHTLKADGTNRGYLDWYLRNPGQAQPYYFRYEGLVGTGLDIKHKFGVSELPRDSWHTFEYHIAIDNISAADGGKGHVRCWVDESLELDLDIATLRSATDYIDRNLILSYWNNSASVPTNSGPDTDQRCYSDELFITTQTPGGVDANGNKRIGQ